MSVWWSFSITKNFFCQICRQIIVLIPKWWTRRFVNVSAAMVSCDKNINWKQDECVVSTISICFFFLNQIKLVFTHELVKGYLLWRAKNKKAERKGCYRKPKIVEKKFKSHRFTSWHFKLASESQATKVKSETHVQKHAFSQPQVWGVKWYFQQNHLSLSTWAPQLSIRPRVIGGQRLFLPPRSVFTPCHSVPCWTSI